QGSEYLPDCSQVIRSVSGRGESGGSGHFVPIGALGDDLSPLFGLAAKAVAETSPTLLGNNGALPTVVPVGACPGICVACRPAIQNGEAEMNVIDMCGDRGFSRHRPLRRRS